MAVRALGGVMAALLGVSVPGVGAVSVVVFAVAIAGVMAVLAFAVAVAGVVAAVSAVARGGAVSVSV